MEKKSCRPIMVVARSFPPSIQSGGSIVLYRLFRKIHPADYVVIRGDQKPIDATRILPVPTLAIDIYPQRFQFSRYSFLFIPLLVTASILFAIRYHPRHILATYPFSFFVISAYYTAKILRLPFSVYFHDVWEEAEDTAIQKKLAGIYESIILRSAVNIFVISEALQEHFSQKYRAETVLLQHPMPLAEFQLSSKPSRDPIKPFHIVYTGQVYWLNRDVVKNLIDAVNSITDISIVIDFYTTQHAAEVKQILGLKDLNHIFIRRISFEEIPKVQAQSDLLFTGVTFMKEFKVAARTTFPTKFVEYLASGSPILVNAPSESFLARFVREHDCALLVDDLQPESLRMATLKLLTDHQFARKLTSAALALSSLYDDDKQAKILAHNLGVRLADQEGL